MARKKSTGSKSQKIAANASSKRNGTARRSNGRAKRSLIARLKFW